MLTFQEMRFRTDMMMEIMRQDAINDSLAKYRQALINYYTEGCDDGQTSKLYWELVNLGADEEKLIDIDYEIREDIFGTI